MVDRGGTHCELGVGRLNWMGFKSAGGLAAILTVLVLAGCGERLPTIDMSGDHAISFSAVKTDERPVLRVAVGSMISPEITREYYQGLMEVVAARVGRRAVFSQRRTYAEVNEMVETHEVDIAFVCSGPYTVGHERFGMELLVIPVVDGQRVYQSYILARRGSGIESFGDLRGKRFAFTDRQSNTGCLVPTYMLGKQGETPESYFGDILFTHSHDNSIKAVADGLADGAAVHSLIFKFMDTIDPSDTSRTKIVGTSPPHGIPPVVVHPDLDGELKRRLKTVLLSIHEDEEALPLLRQIQIDSFAEGDDSMYDSVREMQQWLDARHEKNTP